MSFPFASLLKRPSAISSLLSLKKPGSWSSILLKAVGVLSRDSRWHSDLLKMLTEEMDSLNGQINTWTDNNPLLDEITKPYRKSSTRFFHPLLVLLMSRASVNGDPPSQQLFQRYKQLARVTELIHAANIIHINIGEEQSNEQIKLATLVGDYLLGKASVDLAHLENNAITEIMASVIANLVEGHFGSRQNGSVGLSNERTILLQSAFMPAKACLCASILNNSSQYINDACFNYGKFLGLSLQLAHKPVSPDAQVLQKNNDILKTYVENAKSSLSVFPDIEAKQALMEIANSVSK
ncbi:Decaprenyl diphosphate synthase subunit 2 Dlp1 [Schizosaccharomyces pombe]|uniref:Decaprenyl-diphosphate synthase subunit 2 n=1 Tax=Schizosaccharomyces pombe (strain 972 / ATCC 24843) TaxID=284812 RepID=DLP1_SCHPO|nr:decaprenyl diphosphate synthase subunit 2 Dlp1 [Schizosaccharomyces pombe]O13851.1 RecName: Full=Decaprenyl-diphosphate synthase subunit 2; AltName: Full=All-trans-decaprenyl-diphosphate synthase subunit 2; AltName: Full=Decaprenyl pyrophosphate synthase subunit 2 [Schizosaccharomyces pombe 972h-]BAC82458.1 decaprenyl diphosphate synthase subunit2 [Schizosaccharomyces pombe]CAB10123.1 decaprenyl diphosphate synthase subunit 2 Dlp1 [Schizosaccharomyces pombe]|eukprot:NP_594427.1 decaprenyl diphosphate synthase subunit 2 Dlp1 [Schizosaccharomyces pombe]